MDICAACGHQRNAHSRAAHNQPETCRTPGCCCGNYQSPALWPSDAFLSGMGLARAPDEEDLPNPTPTRDAVERHNPAVRHIVGIGHVGHMAPAADGDWVRYSDHVKALTAAEARGREQERARLAALSPGEVGEMVATPQEIVFEGCRVYVIAPEDYDTLLARLAAARGEALEEAARECDDKATGLHALARIHTKNGSHEAACAREEQADCAEVLAARIRALAAPPATAGEGVGNG